MDTIPETQNLDIDREVVLRNVKVGFGHLPYEEIVDPNAITLPMHSTPGIDSPVIRIQTDGTEYISPVFGIPPQSAARDQTTHQTEPLHITDLEPYTSFACR